MQRITPASLRLTLRPQEPANIDNWAVSQPEHAGREYWTGWVCHKCGCANERRLWHGWTCEGCKVSHSIMIGHRDVPMLTFRSAH